MEYVSVLAGERRRTDRPRCVHPLLALLARQVNDRVERDESRSGLALLTPRLIGTNTDDRRVAPVLTLVCLRVAEAAGAGGPELADRVWRARGALRRCDGPAGPGRWFRGGLSGRIDRRSSLDVAFRMVCAQLRGHPPEARDRWLVELLSEAVEYTHRLLSDRASGSRGTGGTVPARPEPAGSVGSPTG